MADLAKARAALFLESPATEAKGAKGAAALEVAPATASIEEAEPEHPRGDARETAGGAAMTTLSSPRERLEDLSARPPSNRTEEPARQ